MNPDTYEGGAQTQFDEDDFINAAVSNNCFSQRNAVLIKLPVQLPYRRIYFYLEVGISISTANYYVKGELTFNRNGIVMARIPASVAVDVNPSALLKKSVSSPGGSGTQTGNDGLAVFLASSFTNGNTRIIVPPYRVAVEANEVTWSCLGANIDAGSITAIRVYLGVLSSNIQQ